MLKISALKLHLSLAILGIVLIVSGLVIFNHPDSAFAQSAPAAAAPVTAASAPAPAANAVSGAAAVNPPKGTTGGIPTMFGFGITDMINWALANFINVLLSGAAFLLTMAASVLDVSMVLTLHIKDFVDATPAIYTIWQVIRDVTGLFFIFFLLYAAIKMILGFGDSYGKLIKDIVIAAILINFSFFITSVLIDASNVVSQAIYNAMNPKAAEATATIDMRSLSNIASQVTGLEKTGSTASGISTIFMNSLKIQQIYDTSGNKLSTVIGNPIRIVLVGIIGIIIMITAALSFLLAASAFTARLIILIFLLAFSALWFAGTVIPQLNTHIGKFKNALYSQLVFMPVYLLLMYAALRILNESNLMGAANASIASLPTGNNWAFPFIVLVINFAMVIFMLNLPLVVGLGMGGMATSLISKKMKSWDAGSIWKGFGSQAGSRTVGRAAYSLNKNITPWIASKSPLAGSMVNKGLSKVSSGGFGGGKKGSYDQKLKDKAKNYEDLHKQIGKVERGDYKPGDAGKADFDKAKAQAKAYQEKYRAALPWKGLVGSGIGFMFDNRANRRTSEKLSSVADKEDNKKAKKDNIKKISDKSKEIREIEELERSGIQLTGMEGERIRRTREERKEQLRKEIGDLQEKVDKAVEDEKEDANKKVLDKLEDLEKKGGESGGGEKGGGEPKKT